MVAAVAKAENANGKVKMNLKDHPALSHIITPGVKLDVTSMGRGIELVEKKDIDFNVKHADYMLNIDRFIAERPLLDHHVAFLVGQAINGLFRPELVTSIVAYHESKAIRMNSQHTAWMRKSLGANHGPMEVRHLTYACKSEEDLRILYASIDRAAPRTTGHVILSYLAGTPHWQQYSPTLLKKLAEAFGMWWWPNSSARRAGGTPDAKAFLIQGEFRTLAVNVADFLMESQGEDFKFLWRAPVIAAMFGSFRVAVRDSQEFWSSIRDAVGFKGHNDPRRKLRDRLSNTVVSDRGGTRNRQRASGDAMFRWCYYAWDAWQKGEKLELLRTEYKGERPKFKASRSI